MDIITTTQIISTVALSFSVIIAILVAFRVHIKLLPLNFRVFFADTFTVVVSGDMKIWKLQLPLAFTSISPHSVVVQKCILEIVDTQGDKIIRMRWRQFVRPDFVLSHGGIIGKVSLREPSPFYIKENKSELMNIEFISPEEIQLIKGHNYLIRLNVWHTVKKIKKSLTMRQFPELVETATFYFSDFYNKQIVKEVSLMKKEIDNAKKQGVKDFLPQARLTIIRNDDWCKNWEKDM